MKRKTDMFYIRPTGSPEWAYIVADEDTGTFMAHSSFGGFTYRWTHIGERTFAEFLAGLNMEYFAAKTYSEPRVFDFDKTIKNFKTHIIETRREGDISATEARKAWEELEMLDDFDFLGEVHAGILGEIFPDAYDMMIHSPNPQVIGFWNTIWPEFLRMIGDDQ